MAQLVKDLPAMGRPGLDPWVRKIPWRREWLPTPIFLSGEFHGQNSLGGYSSWGRRVGHFLSFFFSFFSFPKDNYNIGGVLRYMNKAIKRSETHFYSSMSLKLP